jgi:glucose/arabinose dehydrogenase
VLRAAQRAAPNGVGSPGRAGVAARPPRAPAVLWLAWNAAKGTLEPAVTLVGGFENADGSYWGRPVDAVPGPDGALYVSDDTAGAIYRLTPAT